MSGVLLSHTKRVLRTLIPPALVAYFPGHLSRAVTFWTQWFSQIDAPCLTRCRKHAFDTTDLLTALVKRDFTSVQYSSVYVR